MAQRKQQQDKDVLKRLADSGEEAVQKFIDHLPGGNKVVGAANSLFARVDELTKPMRSLDPLERSVAELDKQQHAPDKSNPAAHGATSASKTTASKRKPAASRTPRKTPSS